MIPSAIGQPLLRVELQEVNVKIITTTINSEINNLFIDNYLIRYYFAKLNDVFKLVIKKQGIFQTFVKSNRKLLNK